MSRFNFKVKSWDPDGDPVQQGDEFDQQWLGNGGASGPAEPVDDKRKEPISPVRIFRRR